MNIGTFAQKHELRVMIHSSSLSPVLVASAHGRHYHRGLPLSASTPLAHSNSQGEGRVPGTKDSNQIARLLLFSSCPVILFSSMCIIVLQLQACIMTVNVKCFITSNKKCSIIQTRHKEEWSTVTGKLSLTMLACGMC